MCQNVYRRVILSPALSHCGAPGQITAQTNAIPASNNMQDEIIDSGSPGASCTEVTQQTIYFAPVGGGGATNNNSMCSFNNTQTITVTQTNAPNVPPHGTVTTSVTLGSGDQKHCIHFRLCGCSWGQPVHGSIKCLTNNHQLG